MHLRSRFKFSRVFGVFELTDKKSGYPPFFCSRLHPVDVELLYIDGINRYLQILELFRNNV